MQKKLSSNIWKIFLLILTNRRNYLPILSIYFLSLPSTDAKQIGLYTAIGFIFGFILEIPSGYISDKFGHKNTLILGKFSMLFSTFLFSFGSSLSYFILASIFLSIGQAFSSGTTEAFLHNTLVKLKKDKDYGNIIGKIKAQVSLVSAFMILSLPLLSNISLNMPIKLFLIFDIVGIIIAFSLFTPKIKYSAEDMEGENILSQLKRFKGKGFYIFSCFLGINFAIIAGLSTYKEVFAKFLGFPIILIGSIMALSRMIWFIIGSNLKFLEKIKLKKLILCEIFILPILIILSSFTKNPYLFGIIFASILGYNHARYSIFSKYSLDNFLINKRYKATMLSIQRQISILFQSIFSFFIGFLMYKSFNLGFLFSGIIMFILLICLYPFLIKKLK